MTTESLFKQIIKKPEILKFLPIEYQNDIDFLELFYIILEDEIKPYISPEIFNILKRRKIRYKNKYTKQPQNKPNISLEDETILLHNLLTDITTINSIPTTEKYKSEFLELFYIIWGDEIQYYIPIEIYEEIKNEELMKEYHKNHEKDQENWAKEIEQKIKRLSK